jgi:MFS family permease
MIGDYFSPDRRSRAFSVYSLGSSIGAGCAFLFIGSILHALTRWTQTGAVAMSHLHAWQWMFILLGAPGVVSAGLFLLTVKEPPRRELLSKDAQDQAPLASFFQHMRRHAGAYTALFGVGVATGISTYGVIGWFPTFVVRAYGVSAATTAGVMGAIGLPCGLVSSLGGGWVIGEFYRRGRLDGPIVISAASLIILTVGVAVATLSTSFSMTMGGYAIISLMTNVPIVAILTGVNRITPNRMRAQSMAMFSIFTSLISQVAGPLAIGGMAEHLFKGDRGVGYGILTAICVACTLSVLAIIVFRGHFNRAERMMQR